MGADIDELPVTGPGGQAATATVRSRFGSLRATAVEAAEITGLDEVPVLAVAAACAEGETVFFGMSELRLKESDRLNAVARLVRVFGGRAEIDGDDLVVHGSAPFRAGEFDAGGDHRMAMAAAVAALTVEDGSSSDIGGFESVATSYPGFAEDLRLLSGTGTVTS
jgi:3-phosphoshikimate 1-carboxyvinyltransferase